MQFFSTARSSRVCGVYLTQNLPNYYAMMSGARGRQQTDSVVSNLQTKIFHRNDDPTTNNWASDVIARDWHLKTGSSGSNVNLNDSFDHQVPPIEFTRLKNGGPENNFLTDAIVFEGGRVFSNGCNYLKTTFNQKAR
jgi:hypothetical protein